jgi:hypothetical protein
LIVSISIHCGAARIALISAGNPPAWSHQVLCLRRGFPGSGEDKLVILVYQRSARLTWKNFTAREDLQAHICVTATDTQFLDSMQQRICSPSVPQVDCSSEFADEFQQKTELGKLRAALVEPAVQAGIEQYPFVFRAGLRRRRWVVSASLAGRAKPFRLRT